MAQKAELKRNQIMPKEKKISHLKKPEDLTLEAWQILLRKQIAREQALKIKNVGSHPVFSTFNVTNPKTAKTYRVVIAGEALGINYCSCPDFSVNTLGTCKHIESLLHKLRRQRKMREIFNAGFHPDYSAVTLRYGLKRRAAFLLGKKASAELKTLIAEFFDKDFFSY